MSRGVRTSSVSSRLLIACRINSFPYRTPKACAICFSSFTSACSRGAHHMIVCTDSINPGSHSFTACVGVGKGGGGGGGGRRCKLVEGLPGAQLRVGCCLRAWAGVELRVRVMNNKLCVCHKRFTFYFCHAKVFLFYFCHVQILALTVLTS